MSKSEAYLKEAFAGESQANRKYLAYAAKAEQEGYPQAARLFRAAAEAETVHAHNHLKALKAINSTKELVGTHGVYNFKPDSRYGSDERSRVIVKLEKGQWKLIP